MAAGLLLTKPGLESLHQTPVLEPQPATTAFLILIKLHLGLVKAITSATELLILPETFLIQLALK
jgi:hypothetical protein